MEDVGFQRWLDAYARAWESNDCVQVAALFTEDAVYYTDPFREAWKGRDAIVRAWTSDPEQQDGVRFDYRVLAVRGDTGVAHWSVSYVRRAGSPVHVEMDGVLVARFDDHGRCFEHREWYARRLQARVKAQKPARQRRGQAT